MYKYVNKKWLSSVEREGRKRERELIVYITLACLFDVVVRTAYLVYFLGALLWMLRLIVIHAGS